MTMKTTNKKSADSDTVVPRLDDPATLIDVARSTPQSIVRST
jgi:hypothetical protein